MLPPEANCWLLYGIDHGERFRVSGRVLLRRPLSAAVPWLGHRWPEIRCIQAAHGRVQGGFSEVSYRPLMDSVEAAAQAFKCFLCELPGENGPLRPAHPAA